ncbi:MAG: cell division protein FtsL [Pseudomonadota bacterium]
MRTFFYVIVSFCVVAIAFWAYRENYATQQALKNTQNLHAEIRATHARLSKLKAEWAYLNRPDRLKQLIDLNFDKVQLLPLRANQFGRVDQVPYPDSGTIEITNVIDVFSNEPGESR